MNHAKWAKETDLRILALKLGEEVGEVMREITDQATSKKDRTRDEFEARILEELTQVGFITTCLKTRIQEGR